VDTDFQAEKRIHQIERTQEGKGDLIYLVLNEMSQVGFLLDQMSKTKGITTVIFKNPRYLYLLKRYGFALGVFSDSKNIFYYDRNMGYAMKPWGGPVIVKDCPIYKRENTIALESEGVEEYKKFFKEERIYGGSEAEFPIDFLIDPDKVGEIFNWMSRGVIRNNIFGTFSTGKSNDSQSVGTAVRFASGLIDREVRTIAEGAKIPELMERMLTGINYCAINLDAPEDLSFKRGRISEWLDADKIGKMETDGQLKLLVSDITFCIRYNISRPLVIGGSPGEHWRFFEYIQPILVDERAPQFDGAVWIKDLATSFEQVKRWYYAYKCDGVIWDVRADDDLEGVKRDWDLIQKIMFGMSEITNCSIKFKMRTQGEIIERESTIPNIMKIQPQAYRRPFSNESRLEIGPSGKTKTILLKDYAGWSSYLNKVRVKLGEKYIADYLLYCGNRANYLIETPKHFSNLFSISLNHLTIDELVHRMKRCRTFTLINSVGLWANDVSIVGPNKIRFNQWVDTVYDIYEVQKRMQTHYMFTVRDFISLAAYKNGVLDRKSTRGPPINLNCQEAELYVVFVRRDIVEERLDVHTQNWLNAQTHLVKMLTTIMRTKLKLDDMSLHYWRMCALMRHYPEATVYDDIRISGKIGNTVIAIAGHPLNILISSGYFGIDCYRYLNTIAQNIKDFRKKGTKWMEHEKKMLKEGQNAEKARFGLWHNYFEYILAVYTYDLMVEAGFIKKTKARDIFYSFFKKYSGLTVPSQVAEERVLELDSKPRQWTMSYDETYKLCLAQRPESVKLRDEFDFSIN
jgi:hypothetical protein